MKAIAARPCAACGALFTPPRERHRACSRACASRLCSETKRAQYATNLGERLSQKTAKTPTCWLWTGATNGRYGQLLLHGRHLFAHRVAYELVNGPIPAGLVIDHLCNTPLCVRPDHLRAVTHDENVKAPHSRTLARLRSEQTECLRGHPFDEANTAYRKNGTRRCRTCSRDRLRAWQRAQRERRKAS